MLDIVNINYMQYIIDSNVFKFENYYPINNKTNRIN